MANYCVLTDCQESIAGKLTTASAYLDDVISVLVDQLPGVVKEESPEFMSVMLARGNCLESKVKILQNVINSIYSMRLNP